MWARLKMNFWDFQPLVIAFVDSVPLSPALLVSRLLLRMRGAYVASIRLSTTKNEWNAKVIVG